MNPASEYKLTLARRERTLRWTKAAQYWLGKLPHPPSVRDLSIPEKHDSFICDHVWAALDERGRREFPSPADLFESLRALPEDQANDLWTFILDQAYGLKVSPPVPAVAGTDSDAASPDDPEPPGGASTGEPGTKT